MLLNPLVSKTKPLFCQIGLCGLVIQGYWGIPSGPRPTGRVYHWVPGCSQDWVRVSSDSNMDGPCVLIICKPFIIGFRCNTWRVAGKHIVPGVGNRNQVEQKEIARGRMVWAFFAIPDATNTLMVQAIWTMGKWTIIMVILKKTEIKQLP